MLSCLSYSQTLKITIKDEQENIIPVVNILLKEKTTNAILEFTRVFEGNGSYIIKKNYTSIVLEIQSTNYVSKEIEIVNPEKGKEYQFDIILKHKEVQLKEVIIEGKELPYKIKKDTVIFDVSKYKDGSEKKVEDLIKKLPGVEVDANGSIKYKGKSIETVTLDGDNLFNSNYKLGTKNINIDMVEQIEAIDNYTNNKLLKGIESEGKVALNLKLKKGKSDFSGSLENGLGLKNDLAEAYYSNSYIMQISSKMKSFTNLNLNNIGRSDTYFYEKQNSKSLDRVSDENFRTKKVLSDELFQPQLDPIRFNRNSQFYISYNNLYKINKKVSLKINLNLIDDKIDSKQDISTKIFTNSTTIETNDRNNFIKKPKVFTGELELRINTTNTTLLEVYSKQYLEKNRLFSNYIKNKEQEFNNINETQDYFSINKIVHTWKLDTNKALQANLYYTFNKIPQSFISNSITDAINQSSDFEKSVVLFNYNLIGKYKKMNYTFQVGTNRDKTNYLSENNTVNNNSLFINSSFYNNSRVKFNFNKFSIVPNLSVTNYKFSLTNEEIINKNKLEKLIIEPAIDLVYKFGKSTITTTYSNTQKPISEEYIFLNNVFVNNRTTILNQPSFNFKKTNNFLLNYFNNNLLTNTTISFSNSYEISNGQFLNDFTINEDFTIIKNIFYNVENSTFSSNFRYSKFFEKLATTITFSSNYVDTNYPNLFNSNDIRKNSNQVFKNSLEIRTGFDTKINFENAFSHNAITSKSIINKNNISSIQNTLKIRYKINKKNNASLKSDLFVTNLKSNNNYNFIDFEYRYKFNDQVIFMLIANNLLNIDSFNQVENNDFSNFISKTNLTQRFFLFNIEYNF